MVGYIMLKIMSLCMLKSSLYYSYNYCFGVVFYFGFTLQGKHYSNVINAFVNAGHRNHSFFRSFLEFKWSLLTLKMSNVLLFFLFKNSWVRACGFTQTKLGSSRHFELKNGACWNPSRGAKIPAGAYSLSGVLPGTFSCGMIAPPI